MRPVWGMAVALLLLVDGRVAWTETAADAAAARIEGVYKRRFRVEVVGEGMVSVEDVVEIARHAPELLYVRAALHFANGHVCGIHGLARFDAGTFVYRTGEPSAPGAPRCTLTVREQGGQLVLTDRTTPVGPATCAAFCGARGSLSDYRIPMKARRPIRYLPRLKASRQYQEAVAEAGPL